YRRFQARKGEKAKQWKITDEDWRNREKWQWYEEAVNEMLYRTDTLYAPWTVIEANNKEYARLKVFKTMLDRYEKVLKDKGATK
ncbi:MAG: phosphate--AMP phosphotransferase, partial [Acidaminococcaceae bacterium]|nr:phosphate--AMP phosphotransferase [Acidaminococcaceae bacterium]